MAQSLQSWDPLNERSLLRSPPLRRRANGTFLFRPAARPDIRAIDNRPVSRQPAVFGSGPTNRMSAAPPSRLTPYDPDVAGKMDKAAEIIRRYRKTLHLLVK